MSQNDLRKNSLQDEHFLVKAFQKGEAWAFSQIYSRYRKAIVRDLSKRVGDPALAEDLGQEVFIKAFRFRDLYQRQYAFSTWLWTISRNTLSDWFRKEGSKELGVRSVVTEREEVNQIPSSAPTPDEALERKHKKRIFKKLLGGLTELQKMVLHMRLVEHLSYSEIAGTLGISVSAVKCLVYRAKQAMTQIGGEAAFA